MFRMFMLAVALVCSSAWLQAQDPSSQNPQQPSQPASGQAAASGQTVEGCLQGSNGTFTLTDKAGTTYQLQGDTSKLSKHVGHEVQITGSPSSGAASSGTSSGAGAAQGGSQTLTVEKVKHISESCKSK